MDTPGVTRDRIYGVVHLMDKSFHLIDTGGLSLENGDFNKDILAQATLAIDEAAIKLNNMAGFSLETYDTISQASGNYEYYSSNPNIATVSESGVISPVYEHINAAKPREKNKSIKNVIVPSEKKLKKDKK